MRIRRTLCFLALTGALVIAASQSAPAVRAGSMTYEVQVDTSSLSGTTGSIQFTLIAGSTPAPFDTSAISSFTSDGSLIIPPTVVGDVSGALPSTMSMDNQNASLYSQPFVYGTILDFQVTLTSTAGSVSSADTLFSFYLFDASGNPISSSNSPSGEALDINIQGPSGAFDAPVIYAPPPPITVIPVTAAVPEPSSIVLLGVGLGAILARGRRRS